MMNTDKCRLTPNGLSAAQNRFFNKRLAPLWSTPSGWRGHQRHELIVAHGGGLADCVEHHGLRLLHRVGLPLETRLAGIARAREVDPRLRDLVLQGKRGRGASGSE